MFQQLFQFLRRAGRSPGQPDRRLPIIGYTATHFRLDTGYLHQGDDALFQRIAYEVPVGPLIKRGILAPLTTHDVAQIDFSDLPISGDDYDVKAFEEKTNWLGDTARSLAIAQRLAETRKKWIVFACTIRHALSIAEMLIGNNVPAIAIHHKLSQRERNDAITAFMTGECRALISVDCLTTGFDAPNIDCLVQLRPTLSTGLHCLDAETEILTSHGWKGKDDIKVGDCTAAMNIETGKGCWSGVLAKVERPIGNEHWVSFSGQFVNFRVTSNHTMLFRRRKRNSKDWLTGSALKISQEPDKIEIPTAVDIERPGVPLTDAELYLIGMIMTDGTISSHRIDITQSSRYPDVQARIERALEECELTYSIAFNDKPTEFGPRKHPIKIYRICLGQPRMGRNSMRVDWRMPSKTKVFRRPEDALRHGAYRLVPYLSKDFATALMGMSKRQFLIFLQGLWDGDGTKGRSPSVDWDVKTWQLCTARRIVADRIQAVAVTLGFSSSVATELGQSRSGRPIYIVRVAPTNFRSVSARKPASETSQCIKVTQPNLEAAESVWCVETEHGTIVTRRKGRVTVMGNCQMLGRGMRMFPGKQDCLVLDFSGNIARHGPLTDVIPIVREPMIMVAAAKRQPSTKICPTCATTLPSLQRQCDECGRLFINMETAPSTADPLYPEPELEMEESTASCAVHGCNQVAKANGFCDRHSGESGSAKKIDGRTLRSDVDRSYVEAMDSSAGGFLYRRRVPLPLQARVGRTHWAFSLRTKDRERALLLGKRITQKLDQFVRDALNSPGPPPRSDHPLMSTEEAAGLIGVSARYAKQMRHYGTGPVYYAGGGPTQLGWRQIVYRMEDIIAWRADRVYIHGKDGRVWRLSQDQIGPRAETR